MLIVMEVILHTHTFTIHFQSFSIFSVFESFSKSFSMENVVMEHKQCRIEHTKHRLETVDKYKKSLCAYNDKRWIDRNGTEFETYSFGHWRLKGNFLFVLWNYYFSLFSEYRELDEVMLDLAIAGRGESCKFINFR